MTEPVKYAGLKNFVKKNMINEKGHFNLAGAIITSCFLGNNDPKIRFVNKEFAKNSKLISLFADCSNNFESSRLRKEIIRANL